MRQLTKTAIDKTRRVASNSPIGCAFDGAAVRLAQFPVLSNPRLLTAEASYAIQSDGDRRAMPAAIRAAHGSAPFLGRDVVTCLPNDHVSFRRVLIPLLPDWETLQSVREQASRELGRDMRELRSDFHAIGEVSEGGVRRRELIAVTAAGDDISKMSADLHDGGLRPIAVDSGCGALARCLSSSGGAGPVFIVDMNGHVPVIIAAESGNPRFIYTVGSPSAHLGPQQVSEPPRQGAWDGTRGVAELAREVSMCFHYLGDRPECPISPKYGYVVGAGCKERDVVGSLAAAGLVEFRLLSDHHDRTTRDLLAGAGEGGLIDPWVTPLGLAMYGLQQAEGPE